MQTTTYTTMIRFEVYVPAAAGYDRLARRLAALCDGATTVGGFGMWRGLSEPSYVITVLCQKHGAPIIREVIAEHFAGTAEQEALYCESEVSATLIEFSR